MQSRDGWNGKRENLVRMVDVSDKAIIRRKASARGSITLKKSTVKAIADRRISKGDVVSVSKLAGIQAAKATATILPLCHQVPLTSVEVEILLKSGKVIAECTVIAEYRTGVEMEALVGVMAALLNVWDMVKYLEKDSQGQYPETVVSSVRVISKIKGGKAHGCR